MKNGIMYSESLELWAYFIMDEMIIVSQNKQDCIDEAKKFCRHGGVFRGTVCKTCETYVI